MGRLNLIEVLKITIRILNKIGAKWCICGGIAANYYGAPRTTYDIDILLLLHEIKVEKLATFLKVKKKTLKEILKISNRYFWRISTYRVDLWFVKTSYEREVINRRKKVTIDKLKVWLISVEDLIIHKLKSDRPRDKEDLLAIVKLVDKIDWRYINKWCKIFNLSEELKNAKNILKNLKKKNYWKLNY